MRQGDTQEEGRSPARGSFELEETRKSLMNLTLNYSQDLTFKLLILYLYCKRIPRTTFNPKQVKYF